MNRFDSVMMILCGSPLAPLMSRKPSAPAPPDLLMTTSGCFMMLCLTMTPWIRRAIWSAPPPVPAGTMNSTGLVGSHAAIAGPATSRQAATAVALKRRTFVNLCILFLLSRWDAAVPIPVLRVVLRAALEVEPFLPKAMTAALAI